MEQASDGFERIALALMEIQQRTEALLEENRRLHAEPAALRQGAGILVAIEGRFYSLTAERSSSNEPLYPPR